MLAALSVLTGAILAGGDIFSSAVVYAAGAAFLVCAFGNIVNDTVDIEADRVNHPTRVLVSGFISKQAALVAATVSAVLSLVVAKQSNDDVFVFAGIAMALLTAYNFGLKRTPFVGNLAVASVAALTFFVGGLAVDALKAVHLPGPLVASGFAVLLHLMREIIKDVEDIEGDRLAHITTLPQKIGVRSTLVLTAVIQLVFVYLVVAPFLLGWFNVFYLVLGIAGVCLPVSVTLFHTLTRPTGQNLRRLSTMYKFAMFIGLVALAVGQRS